MLEVRFNFPGAAEEGVDAEDAGEFAHAGLDSLFDVGYLDGGVERGTCWLTLDDAASVGGGLLTSCAGI